MRDIIVIGIILLAAPIALFYPFFGVLMWTWIAYFNPHRFTWGFAYNFPVAKVIAVPTILGTLFTRQRNRDLLTRETVLLFLLWLWFAITLFHAATIPLLSMHVADGWEQWKTISTILTMTALTVLLTDTPKKMRYLLLVTAFSFGLLAIKGALFGALTGGDFRVMGPPDSFVADNNDLGLAMNMVLPLIFFLGSSEPTRKMRIVLRVCFVSAVVVSLLTYSRGALLGISTVLLFIVVKTRRKFIGGAILVAAALMVIAFAPEKWHDRMDAFVGGQLDRSADQRFVSWAFAWNVAQEYPVTGGGFESFTPEMFARFSKKEVPGGYGSSGPHSIYFQIIGEQGFVGLGLFLGLIGSCVFTLRGLRKRIRDLPPLHWMNPYTNGVEGGFYAFLISGAFLGRAYFDLFYQLVACTIILKILFKKCAWELQNAPDQPVQLSIPEFEEAVTP